jgi:phosphatidylserine decarboxylase
MGSPNSQEIRIWNRAKGHEEVELVYGGGAIDWLYGTRLGRFLADRVLSAPWFSKLYGAFQSTALSRLKIKPFIRDFSIPMELFEAKKFANFNEFFIRKFRSGARPIAHDAKRMPAFAEARYLAWERISLDQTFPVKGASLTAAALLRSDELAKTFEGGPLMIARLCPTDYHRFHFPDDGTYLTQSRLPGGLHSVNPAALKYYSDIFATNERQVSILQTENFGKLAYIEVGALCVGKIVQTHPTHGSFRRGEEKGYFLFGGSTVIVIGEPGRWVPDADIIQNTAMRREVLICLGEGIASAVS